VTDESTCLIDEIRSLLADPADGDRGPYLARVEDTLAIGYARALALEAERLRLERSIDRAVATIDEGDVLSRAEELGELARRRSATHDDLDSLKALLGSLRDRARILRRAPAADSAA
jgi:hypothetical protein